MKTPKPFAPPQVLRCLAQALCAAMILSLPAWANEPAAKPASTTKKPLAGEVSASTASNPKDVGNQVREALGTSIAPNKKLTVTVAGKGSAAPASATDHSTPSRSAEPVASQASKKYIQARAAALAGHATAGGDSHGGEAHWAYEGESGPSNWGKLKPEFNVCAIGKRQSPINIQDGSTLAGPAEPIQFNYSPSNASVVNNGHTIQVDVQGNNFILVRGTRFQLLQFHFHTPSEEQINYRRFAMVAHLVHKSDDGQLAVVAVLMDPGESNLLIEKVWTYMPLDANDRVRMPPELLNLNELLPADQRYYQFMGSLTTPPCTEGVLWMVLKTPVAISREQYRLFTQLYPLNARPVQALNGRPVREAQ